MSDVVRVRAGNPVYAVKKYYRNNKKRIDKNFFVFSFLVLPIVLFCIFYIYVNLDSFVMAFKNIGTLEDGSVGEYWTLDNFKNIGDILKGNGKNLGILAEATVNTLFFNAVNILLVLPTTTFK